MEKDQENLLMDISQLLENCKIPYMITGAWSVIYYGRPRASHDIDFIVELKSESADKLISALAQYSDSLMFQPEAIRESVMTKNMFNVLHLSTMLKLDFWLLAEDAFDQSRFQRRQRVAVLGKKIYFTSPEDTILQKLRWYKKAKIEKHLVDAAFVYKIQVKNLDKKYLKKWLNNLNLEESFNELKKIDLEEYL